jgi:branched-chain amino acid transport system ATP-binding protein
VALELRHITAGYGRTTVLRDVSLVVPSGAVVALIGPNGAGKTTLMRVASGLLRPAQGSVLLDGVELAGSRPHDFAAAGICHVPEGRAVFPSMSVRDNLLVFSPRGWEADAVERATASFPALGRLLGRTVGSLSGGEQQMLALTRAYLSGARVILLDEVSLGLAPKIVDEIFEFLRSLARADVSLLIVEQYVNKALEISEYVYVLTRGQVKFAGDPSELADEDVFQRYLGIDVDESATAQFSNI